MSSKVKALVLGGSAIALVALAVAMLRGMTGASPDAAATAVASPPAPSAAPGHAALPPRSWTPDTTYVYEIENSRVITMRGDQGTGQPQTLALAGRLSIAVVGPTPDSSGILLRMSLASDRPELSRGFHAVVEPTGRLASFAFPRGLDGDDRATLKVLASALQVVVPDRTAAAWRATELDASGEYEAAYRAGGRAIHKAKERFVRVRGPRGLTPIEAPLTYGVMSSIELELDTSGWPRTASEDEALVVTAGEMRIEARSRTRARLAATEHTPELRRLAAAEQGGLEADDEADDEQFADAQHRADLGLVDGASYASLLGDLSAGDSKRKNRAMARLAALFRVQPEEAERAADSLLRDRLGGEPAKRLLGALGAAGTAEAQEALASVLDAAGAPLETRSDAAAALGMTMHPTDESKQALLRATASPDAGVAGTAMLGLGNLARQMDAEGSGDPSDAIAALIGRLAAATSDAERIACLDALGNTGAPAALSAIEPYLAANGEAVRTAAVEALRFIAGTDAQVLAALSDAAPKVRRAAAGALGYRAIAPLLAAVTPVLKRDPDTRTRLALVGALQLRRRLEPALADLLAWSAAHDPAEEVRSAARTDAASG